MSLSKNSRKKKLYKALARQQKSEYKATEAELERADDALFQKEFPLAIYHTFGWVVFPDLPLWRSLHKAQAAAAWTLQRP